MPSAVSGKEEGISLKSTKLVEGKYFLQKESIRSELEIIKECPLQLDSWNEYA